MCCSASLVLRHDVGLPAQPAAVAAARRSGLQYKVLTAAPAGAKSPKAGTPCECHYRGTLIDGTEFDSSYKRGQPATFAPNQVVKGWTEAMQIMGEGDKWELYIPSELAYGDRDRGQFIKVRPRMSLIVLAFWLTFLRLTFRSGVALGRRRAAVRARDTQGEGRFQAEAVDLPWVDMWGAEISIAAERSGIFARDRDHLVRMGTRDAVNAR